MAPTPKELRDLPGEIMDEYPLAKIGFDPLPSGVSFLDVVLGRRRFVLEFHPTHGTGVCEITDDTTPFDAGYDHLFDSVSKAAEYLKLLLADAAITEVNHMPQVYVPKENSVK